MAVARKTFFRKKTGESPNLDAALVRVDAQHRELLGKFEDFSAMLKRNTGREALVPMLQDLCEYAQRHLSDEEDLMVRAGYREYAVHCAQHAYFVDQLTGFLNAVTAKDLALDRKLFFFLKRWIADHIEGHDREMAAQIQQRSMR